MYVLFFCFFDLKEFQGYFIFLGNRHLGYWLYLRRAANQRAHLPLQAGGHQDQQPLPSRTAGQVLGSYKDVVLAEDLSFYILIQQKVLTAGHPTLYFCYKSKPLFNT